jgi:signal transduction histidine kinase
VAQLQSDFVSAVSHEFRSPLTSLRGIAELLANDRIADESRRRQGYAFLERETGRLQRLVEDLLDFGRMESGRKQYRVEPHDVFDIVRAAVTDFREEAMAGGFQVESDLDSREATIEADEEALRRAIRNLLENAVKYSQGCRTVWVEGRVNHRQVAISVRDRGMGIEPREQREIFQKFVRGAAAKKAGIKGTGIGLSMVRQIVDACGGEIRLESAAGAGSTFTILLPLAGGGEPRK